MDLFLKNANIKLIGRGADVALRIPVSTRDAEYIGDHHIVADVEFTVVVE